MHSPNREVSLIVLKNLFEIANILHCKNGLLKTKQAYSKYSGLILLKSLRIQQTPVGAIV
jgi:hypothetical protein